MLTWSSVVSGHMTRIQSLVYRGGWQASSKVNRMKFAGSFHTLELISTPDSTTTKTSHIPSNIYEVTEVFKAPDVEAGLSFRYLNS